MKHDWSTITPNEWECFNCGKRTNEDAKVMNEDCSWVQGNDPINPNHYKQGAVECIDAIEASLGREGFIAFLRGQVLKYTWRTGLKDDPAQDAKKAQWYQERLIKTLEGK